MYFPFHNVNHIKLLHCFILSASYFRIFILSLTSPCKWLTTDPMFMCIVKINRSNIFLILFIQSYTILHKSARGPEPVANDQDFVSYIYTNYNLDFGKKKKIERVTRSITIKVKTILFNHLQNYIYYSNILCYTFVLLPDIL